MSCCCRTIWDRKAIPREELPLEVWYRYTDNTGKSGFDVVLYYAKAKNSTWTVERDGKLFLAHAYRRPNEMYPDQWTYLDSQKHNTYYGMIFNR